MYNDKSLKSSEQSINYKKLDKMGKLKAERIFLKSKYKIIDTIYSFLV